LPFSSFPPAARPVLNYSPLYKRVPIELVVVVGTALCDASQLLGKGRNSRAAVVPS
jgi:hypothetical protein